MLIQLQQSDIESAIKNYIATMGLNRPVSNIQIRQSRNDGTVIYNADITLSTEETSRATSNPTTAPVRTIGKLEIEEDKVVEEVELSDQEEVPEENDSKETTSIFG